ncbi:peptidase S8 [Burkholderia cenocepacia]|nr:peptidase S8 [Burkholderia cenocepacia]
MLRLSLATTERRHESALFDASTVRHASLLAFLDRHPLVRRISLPGIVVQSERGSPRMRPESAELPVRDATRSYPKLGIIDGGVGEALSDWVTGKWDLMADGDGDPRHGTFIGGLAVAGLGLNGPGCCPEADGAELVDIAVFPDTDQPGVFQSYYPDGVPQFFDEVESAVADARARYGVRVYNMSLNVVQPARPDRYSPYASRLDQIADAQDVLLFVSAGNLDGRDLRAEWSSDPATSLAGLAAARNDGLFMPAESVRSVTVAAVNPPGHETAIAHAPSRYSRRGPGLRAGGKPDLAHIGGWGSAHPTLGHGLFSITPHGALTDGCGTSYATPLVAKTASVLDHLIEGEVSRETLIGLLAHHAKIPRTLEERTLTQIARHLVGFGVPPSAHEILEKDDHEITLVIASRIRRNQQAVFRFPWPSSLVGDGGKCRGRAKLTLVASPPIDPRFGAEFVRVNIEAALQQEQSNGRWKGRLDAVYLPGGVDVPIVEAELIEHGMKWSPVKMYEKTFPKGVGPSSNWRLAIEYLTRSGEEMPDDGVPFTAILTISDPKGEQPVFNEMRQTLTAQGIQIADIRTAARITPRV